MIKMPWDSVIESVVSGGMELIDDAFHTDSEKAEEKRELLKMQFQQVLQQNLAQLKVNEAEARSGKAGWRNNAGSLCIISLAYAWLLQPLATFAAGLWGVEPPPVVPTEMQFVMLTGMLGLGGIRAHDLRVGSRM